VINSREPSRVIAVESVGVRALHDRDGLELDYGMRLCLSFICMLVDCVCVAVAGACPQPTP